MKTLSLFLKDGKLKAAFLPEKPVSKCFTPCSLAAGANVCACDGLNESYERAKSEALTQAMEVVNPELFPVQKMKEGEFYLLVGGEYDLVQVKSDFDVVTENYEYQNAVKLLPGNVKEDPFDEFVRVTTLELEKDKIQADKEAFAIRFAEWIIYEEWQIVAHNDESKPLFAKSFQSNDIKTTSELMEEFKKEKI